MSKITSTSLQILSYMLTLLFLTLPFHGNSQTTSGLEQTILLKLKQHWSNPPSINHWTSSSNSTSIHCTWPEINCTDGSVTGITLADRNISGTFPPFICDLQNLTHIDLYNNNINGPFPTVLYNCSKLQYLDLSQNYFLGRIPDDVNRLSTRLQVLNLYANYFTGDIPPAIGQLSELKTLQLHVNAFNGSVPPEIGDLSNLEILRLAYNALTPWTMPSSFGQLKKLTVLWMAQTNLTGPLPETMGNMTALEYLDLSMNHLTGNIPSGLLSLKNLTILYLYKNRLSGAIPTRVEALNLDVIDLSENNLTGTIPDGFGKLTKLTGLALFLNQLSGEVPYTIGRLSKLVQFKVFSNKLSGELPPDLGRYSMLEVVYVSSNRFTGPLPEYLCANGVLVDVMAHENNFTGELPNSLGKCSSLSFVWVRGNRLSGDIPTGLWTSFNLTELMISDNSFTGQLPDKVATNLSKLWISNNQFSGEIPAGISSGRNLMVFNASNNLFNGTIPQGLTALPLLTTLLLDGNQLSGHFPSEIVAWRSLNILNLSRNRLSGQIPPEIGSLHALTDLDLSGNQLSGQIPPQLGLLRLPSINLSSNHLTGKIPVEFEYTVFNSSFLNNPDLCASNPSLGIDVCSSGPRKLTKLSTELFAILASIAAVLFVLIMLFGLFAIRYYGKRKRGLDLKWKLTPFVRLNFTDSNILTGLIENNVIGSGGSGKVYRVAVNHSGDEFVAVKRIWNNKKLDQRLEKEFEAEVEILGTIRHSNIVKLLCCLSSDNSKLLVYEFSENRSLDRWLHRKKTQSSHVSGGSVRHVVLDWPKRLQIAVGAARGLCYMHHDCSPSIVHRDVKSSNILLDSEFNAKIADFGLARILIEHGEPNTVSAVAGSFGYIAPEYAHTRRVNEKIDVYSFGVVLLELVTGREANDGDENTCLAEWAWQHIREDNPIVDALDADIKEAGNLGEMSSVFNLGIVCTGTLPSSRPTMKEVLQILLRCNHPPAFGQKNGRSEYDAAPLLKNSTHRSMLEYGNGGFAFSV
uniref:non-specific serine/threonine protein kinase n=1 Tax=Davidia involucrata TaxID=16924 RepID=A0A5B6YW78_DAVIN